MKVITLEALRQLSDVFTVLDDSPRGATTKALKDVKVGDAVVIADIAVTVIERN